MHEGIRKSCVYGCDERDEWKHYCRCPTLAKLAYFDQIRQWTINALMCQFQLDKDVFEARFHTSFDDYFSEEQDHITQCIEDQLIVSNGDKIQVTDLGKIFIRNICMGFDLYLRQKNAHQRFSRTV